MNGWVSFFDAGIEMKCHSVQFGQDPVVLLNH